jgi:sulfide:quinone oxidoreductase
MPAGGPTRVLVLGAGFGGLELSTNLSETLGDQVQVTLIEQGDAFVFGYSKLDVMFGRTTLDAVRLPYSDFAKPGVTLVHEKVMAINPEERVVTTDDGDYQADILVIALGADYDYEATPGLDQENEFYSVAGAEKLGEILPDFTEGRAVIGACGAPFKCPPAPSEAALLLHDLLESKGVRDDCGITLLMPLPRPVPPSPDTSDALEDAFAERGIEFRPDVRIASIDSARKAVELEDGTEVPYDLFLGVPRHSAPSEVIASEITEGGYIPVDSATLRTRYPGVYALGDVATVGVPKAGVFAEGAARVVAAEIVAAVQRDGDPDGYDGRGSCFIEFGGGRVGRVDVDFLGGPKPTGTFQEPSIALVEEKERFGSSRRARWFG